MSRLNKTNIANKTKALEMTKTVYIDLDGTLLGKNASLLHNAKGERSDVGVDALAKAEQAGLDLVITTGRDQYRAQEFARVIGLENYIAELGCVIKHGESIVIDYGPTVDELLKSGSLKSENFLKEIKSAADFIVKKFSGMVELHARYNRDQHASIMLKGSLNIEETNSLLAENGWPYLELNSNGHGMYKRTMPGVNNVLIYHLAPTGVRKASGIAKDQELRGLDKQNCFMIGDGMADVMCSEYVNTVYVPINGVNSDEDVAKYADSHDNVVVLNESHNEGFAKAIDLILEQN